MLNVFLLPDGSASTDIVGLKSLSRRFETAVEGVAQVQIVTPGDMSPARAADIAGEILAGMQPLLRVLWPGDQT